MKIEWLNKSGSVRLILIFAGWSTDGLFYSHIRLEGWDVAVVSGYSDLSFPSGILDGYNTIAVFAWSMGVYAASRVLKPGQVAIAVAVNGTEFPVHDNFGIPCEIFEGTAMSLSDRNLTKFRKRVAGRTYESIKDLFDSSRADIDRLKNELNFIVSQKPTYTQGSFRWHRIYASDEDRIFPYESQIGAWLENPFHPEIVTLHSPHYVDLFPIIKGILPSGKKIGERFRKAIPTYDAQASAQKTIAKRLTELSPESGLDNIVEIGPGTGLFTRMISRKCKPKKMIFVDLYELDPFKVAPCEEYHIGDAEAWIENAAADQPASLDAIVSASAIQWFADPHRFIKNAARLLKPGGILLCSTFLPGNLSELKDISPYGLLYRKREEIEEMLKESFTDVNLSDESLPLSFSSSRETLLHLSHTGVGGSSSSGIPLHELLKILPPRLTYRPLFIKATL